MNRTVNPEQYAALRHAAVAVALDWRGVIEMTGRDRVRFLHGMCTNDIKKLQPGESCMAAIVNRQGKMTAEIVVHATESALLLEVDRSNLQQTLDALAKFIVADDVHMKISDLAVIGVYGPKAQEAIRGGDLVIRRNAILNGIELLIPPGRHAAVDVPRADQELYEVARIEAGFPRWGADMDSEVLPMEAGLEPIAISYTKGCYLGQEVIQRVKTYSEPPKSLVQLIFDGAEIPSPETPILFGTEAVGRVTSAAYSPSMARAIALGYIRKEHKTPGTRVSAAGLPAGVVALPWQ